MKYSVPLDLLRLAAIFLVLGRHMEKCPAEYPLPVRALFNTWRKGGWIGVDLFFVLSGFLISGLLFYEYRKTAKLRVGNFYLRRGFKIYPPFYLMVGLSVLVLSPPAGQIVAECLFVQSYFPGIWNHTWSLAVEEHFYFLLPAFLLLLIRWKRLHWVPWAALCLAITCLSARIATWLWCPPYSHMRNLFATHLRLDSLFFGVAIGYAFHFHEEAFRSLKPRRFWLIALGIVLLSPAFAFTLETTPAIYTIGLTLFYLGSGAILVGSVLCEPKSRTLAALAFVGACSYSTYLWHVPVLHWMPQAENYFTRVFAFVVVSLFVGIVGKLLIENPSMAIRKKLAPPIAGSTPLLQMSPQCTVPLLAPERLTESR